MGWRQWLELAIGIYAIYNFIFAKKVAARKPAKLTLFKVRLGSVIVLVCVLGWFAADFLSSLSHEAVVEPAKTSVESVIQYPVSEKKFKEFLGTYPPEIQNALATRACVKAATNDSQNEAQKAFNTLICSCEISHLRQIDDKKKEEMGLSKTMALGQKLILDCQTEYQKKLSDWIYPKIESRLRAAFANFPANLKSDPLVTNCQKELHDDAKYENELASWVCMCFGERGKKLKNYAEIAKTANLDDIQDPDFITAFKDCTYAKSQLRHDLETQMQSR